jgi:hypothetical protein
VRTLRKGHDLSDTHIPDPEAAAIAAFIGACGDAYIQEVRRTDGRPQCLHLPPPQTVSQYHAFNQWQADIRYHGRIEFILALPPIVNSIGN